MKTIDLPGADSQERVLESLYTLLQEYPQGLKEFDLLQRLRQEGWPAFDYASPAENLTLFRLHFLLFHLLYLLQGRLRESRRADLEIHCLCIAVRPLASNPDQLPAAADPLRGYYLEPRHLMETGAAEVEALLSAFWHHFTRWDQQEEALAQLALPIGASRGEIQARFRTLAKQHHPDYGGDGMTFMRLHEATRLLLGPP